MGKSLPSNIFLIVLGLEKETTLQLAQLLCFLPCKLLSALDPRVATGRQKHIYSAKDGTVWLSGRAALCVFFGWKAAATVVMMLCSTQGAK